ncbi:MAG: flagellar biosynthesis protein FliQ [Phycisphaerae bacterium]|nr:flagellar biosynthesis protein FliQ [Phycisphaerae bacterium]
MDLTSALDLGRDALLLVLVVASPILLMGLCVGLLIAVFQAMTQLQEQTLTFVPKIAAMAIAATFLGPWLATRMLEYAAELFGTTPW